MNTSRLLSLVVLGTASLAACSSGPDLRPCPTPDVSLTHVAGLAYVDALEPTPRKFLFATHSSWGDSALPDAAAKGIDARGPSYIYPPDPNLNKQVRDRLIRSGPFSGFLPFYHGMQVHGDTVVDFTFSGRFVTGEYDNLVMPHKTVRLYCNGYQGEWTADSTWAADSLSADSADAPTS